MAEEWQEQKAAAEVGAEAASSGLSAQGQAARERCDVVLAAIEKTRVMAVMAVQEESGDRKFCVAKRR